MAATAAPSIPATLLPAALSLWHARLLPLATDAGDGAALPALFTFAFALLRHHWRRLFAVAQSPTLAGSGGGIAAIASAAASRSQREWASAEVCTAWAAILRAAAGVFTGDHMPPRLVRLLCVGLVRLSSIHVVFRQPVRASPSAEGGADAVDDSRMVLLQSVVENLVARRHALLRDELTAVRRAHVSPSVRPRLAHPCAQRVAQLLHEIAKGVSSSDDLATYYDEVCPAIAMRLLCGAPSLSVPAGVASHFATAATRSGDFAAQALAWVDRIALTRKQCGIA